MRKDYKDDWADASIVKDLNYIKTGVNIYSTHKEYYSTGSITDLNNSIRPIYLITWYRVSYTIVGRLDFNLSLR